jgi:hypothetical protein
MPIDPNISLGVKPIDFLGSAGNLLNLARGAQAFEQEQVMNPIQQQKAALELGIAQATKDAEIARQKALSGSAVTAEQVGRFNQAGSIEERLRQNFAPLTQQRSFANPAATPQAAIKDVLQAKRRAIAAGVPEDAAEYFAASLYSNLAKAQETGDSTPVNEWMFRNLMASQTPSAQQQLMAPAGAPQVNFGGVPGSVVSTPAGATFKPTLIAPPQPMPAEQMPQGGATTDAIQPPKLIMQPAQVYESSLRPIPPGMAAASTQMQPAAPAQPQGVSAGAMSMPGLRYPVRQQGVAFLPAQGEEADREIGMKYVNGLVSLQPQMQTTRRNIQEVVSKANEIEKNAFQSTGVLGAAERKIRELVGDTNYQQLSKDLANLQISLIQSKGGSLDTVAGQGLAQHANGDKTYGPDVLRAIARRTYGDVLATEAEGAAADLFRQRYGDANHAAFKQLWSKNSDSRVFELMGLQDLIQDPKEQEKVTKEVILKGLSPKQIDELTKKYRNIKRLRETGSL